MAQPIWVTSAGSIGSYPYGYAASYVLLATPESPATSVSYQVLAGSLPNGIVLNINTGILSGTPALVTSDTLTIFTVRATDNLNNIRDRTFSMLVTGTATPQFTTPSGVILTTQDSVWTQLQIAYSNPKPDNVVLIELQQGLLPPGIEISTSGLIQGYPQPPTTLVTLPLVTTASSKTEASTSLIYCVTVNGMTIGRPITFTNVIGGITAGQTYYIKTIDALTNTLTISTTQNGSTFPLSNEVGDMDVTLPAVSTGQPTIRTYNFVLSLISALGNATSSYSITVINQNTPVIQGGPGNPANTRQTTFLNTRPLTITVNDSDPYYGYYLLPPVATSTNAQLGTFLSDNYFAFKLIGYDFDGSGITYYVSGLPQGITYDSITGWITGTPILSSEGINNYSFTAQVVKTGDNGIASPVFNFAFNLSLNITGNITWVTPQDLGTIYNETLSILKVVAISDTPLEYRLTSGGLPPNLTLLPNGEITGIVASQPTETLLTVGEETSFTFMIQAYSPNFGIVQSSKTFTVNVYQEYGQPTDILYIQAAPSINDRNILQTLLDSEALIPTSLLYRPDDTNFGKATSVIYEHAYGIFASNIQEYIASVTQNHYWRNITLGELKTAVARDNDNNIIYEVVYSEVIDNLVNPQGVSVPSNIYWPIPIDLGLGPWYTSITDIYTSYYFGQPGNTLNVTGTTITTNLITCSSTVGLLPGREVIFSGTTFGNIVAGTTYYVRSVDSLTQFTISTTAYNGTAVVLTTATGSITCTIYEPTYYTSLTPGYARTLYPNSLFNMRNRVASVLGQVLNSTLLPVWMTSQQLNGSTLGYTQAWVICFTKPGQAETIKNNIQTNWPYTLNQINFNIDRFTVNKSTTYNWENNLNPPAWSGLPSATPVPNPINSQDFFVLFPRETILPDETQY